MFFFTRSTIRSDDVLTEKRRRVKRPCLICSEREKFFDHELCSLNNNFFAVFVQLVLFFFLWNMILWFFVDGFLNNLSTLY